MSLLAPCILFAEETPVAPTKPAKPTKLITPEKQPQPANPAKVVPNPKLTPLFDGETLAGWVDKNGKPVEEGKWVAENGVLSRVEKGAGQLYSAKEYGDFNLNFEWKISEGGNSGVKYRVQDIDGEMLGLEYQILDDKNHPDNKQEDHLTGAIYDLRAPLKFKPLKPVGEWNRSRIVVKDGLVHHYLNDALVAQMNIPSPDWQYAFANSKYKKFKGFGVNKKGRLLLQDHGDAVSFRNISILEF